MMNRGPSVGREPRKTVRPDGGRTVADWPTHKVKQRRKRRRRIWLRRNGFLSHVNAEVTQKRRSA